MKVHLPLHMICSGKNKTPPGCIQPRLTPREHEAPAPGLSAMPRFYFDSYDGEIHLRDDTGLEMKDVKHAEVEAARGLAEMALELGSMSRLGGLAIAVRDEDDREVLKMRMLFEITRT